MKMPTISFSHTIILPISIPDQKAGSCAFSSFKNPGYSNHPYIFHSFPINSSSEKEFPSRYKMGRGHIHKIDEFLRMYGAFYM